jgi:sugar phosphate isomerase/epimerase
VHLKDLVRVDPGSTRYVLSGEGEFPFDTMFASLHQIGYEGFISFEWEKLWHIELAPPEVALPHFINWWKSVSKR